MATVVDGKIIVDGCVVGSLREYQDAPRRYVLA